MTYCTECGAARAATARFCAECGAPVAAPATDGESPGGPASGATSARVLPPAAAAATPAAAPISVDWRRLLAGNWLGSGVVAVVVAAVAGLTGLLLALLAKPVGFGLDNTLTLATVIATGAFGADLRAEASDSGDSPLSAAGVGTLGAVPLTVTILACVVALLLFRRMTRALPTGGAALGDAARTSVLFGVAMWLPALVFRSDNDEMGGGWGSSLDSRSAGADVSMGADAVGALFLPMVVLFVVLALSTLVRADWWTGRTARARALLAGPVTGLGALVALLPFAGAIGYLAVAVAGDSSTDPVDYTADDWGALIAGMVAYAGNAGFWMLGLGAGAPLGGEGTATGEGTSSEWQRLWGQITEEEPGLWVSPFVLVAVLAVAALVVLRRTPPEDALPRLGTWFGSLVVALPLLARTSSLHVHAEADIADENYSMSAYAGPDGVQTTLLVLLAAVVVTVALALLTGRLDRGAVGAGLTRAVRAASSATAPPAPAGQDAVPPPPPGHPVDRLEQPPRPHR